MGTPEKIEWKEFDYGSELTGVFWIVVQSPEYEVDADDSGQLVGGIVGVEEPVVILCVIEYDGDGHFYTYRDLNSDYELALEDHILLYADPIKPDLPEQAKLH